MARVTEHAARRMKERCGLNKKSLERIASKAFEKGLTTKQVKGEVLSFMLGVKAKSCSGSQVRLYADKTWIFANGNLITVYNTPANLKGKIQRFLSVA